MSLPVAIQFVLVGLVCLGLGGLIGWLLGTRRAPGAADPRLEIELRQQAVQREAELKQARADLAETGNARAAAEAKHAAAERLLAEHRALHEKALAEARETQAKALADLRDTFKALSADALKENQPEFLRLANETFAKLQESAKGDLAQRQESIKGLVEPLRQQLESYQQRLQQSETEQASTLGEVKKQLDLLSQQSLSLANETQQFRMVLKSPTTRGRWGEETLRRVVEAAGMSVHCDFSEQVKEGDAKPDLVVRLPGDRFIIVDAKVPDLDFLSALESADPAKRAESLALHAAKLKGAIKALTDRNYPAQFPGALDYVVLFVPAESLFSAALEGDRELIVWAAEKKILLATPASLIALLRSVLLSWSHFEQTENTAAIAAAAKELFTRVCKFMEHFVAIRDGLNKANEAFNKATASYDSRIRPSGEKLIKIGGAGLEGELPEVSSVDTTLRLPSENS